MGMLIGIHKMRGKLCCRGCLASSIAPEHALIFEILTKSSSCVSHQVGWLHSGVTERT
jgi:hypothetical protein